MAVVRLWLWHVFAPEYQIQFEGSCQTIRTSLLEERHMLLMPLLCVCVQALAGLDLMIRTSYSWCSLQHSPDPTAAEKILWDFANYSLFGFDVFWFSTLRPTLDMISSMFKRKIFRQHTCNSSIFHMLKHDSALKLRSSNNFNSKPGTILLEFLAVTLPGP